MRLGGGKIKNWLGNEFKIQRIESKFDTTWGAEIKTLTTVQKTRISVKYVPTTVFCE